MDDIPMFFDCSKELISYQSFLCHNIRLKETDMAIRFQSKNFLYFKQNNHNKYKFDVSSVSSERVKFTVHIFERFPLWAC